MGRSRGQGIAIALALAVALGGAPLAAGAAAEPEWKPPQGPWSEADWQPLGPWRLVASQAVPWPDAGARPAPDPALQGAALRFAAGRVEGPPPLACEGATYEVVLQPAEGLFQGALPAPAEPAARALGFASFPVATLRVACSGGSFDYHFRDDATLLTALDAVLWRLERARAAGAPSDVVQRLLLDHVTHDMGFTEAGFARKTGLLAPALVELGRRALAAQAGTEEAPLVNGDPFTNSQEYPDRFALGASEEQGGRASVPVFFADAQRRRRVDYLLERAGGAWRVTDLRYEDGSTLRALLEAAVAEDAGRAGGGSAP
jgi:hypothetical protein